MLKLPPAEQAALLLFDPATFSTVPGTRGERGSTYVQLHTVQQADFQAALKITWRGVAPKRLIAAADQE